MRGRLCFLSLNALPYLTSTDNGFVGGAETQEVRLARRLVELGWEVTFLTEDHGLGLNPDGGSIDVRTTYDPHAGLPILRFLHPRLSSVKKALGETPADVYLTRTASIWVDQVARHARSVGASSVFALSHDREACLDTEEVLNFRDRLLYRRGLRHVGSIVAQTHSQANMLRRTTGREAVVIHNGIESRPLSRVDAGGGRPTILWVGTFRRWKRPERFLDLAQAFPALPFVMAGGPAREAPEVYQACKERADRCPNVTLLGNVDPAKMDEVYDRSHLLVCTSESEGFPNTFLEAWTRGIPVVSTGVDPQGWLAADGAVASTGPELAQLVSRLATRPDQRTTLGAQGHGRVSRHCNIKKTARDYDRMLRVIMHGARRRPRAVMPSVVSEVHHANA